MPCNTEALTTDFELSLPLILLGTAMVTLRIELKIKETSSMVIFLYKTLRSDTTPKITMFAPRFRQRPNLCWRGMRGTSGNRRAFSNGNLMINGEITASNNVLKEPAIVVAIFIIN
jgi:hypothetical protein